MNDQYKRTHAPRKSENVKYHQGYYIPEHPEKWLTKENVFRSSWEFLFCKWADQNPAVLKVASEPIGIKYLDPTGNLEYCMKHNLDPNNPQNWKARTYYTDFWIEIADETKPDGKKRIFIEIKPYDQTQCPKPLTESASLKEHKAYNRAAQTYLTNVAKWQSAREYFKSRGAEFMVITERTLQQLGLL